MTRRQSSHSRTLCKMLWGLTCGVSAGACTLGSAGHLWAGYSRPSGVVNERSHSREDPGLQEMVEIGISQYANIENQLKEPKETGGSYSEPDSNTQISLLSNIVDHVMPYEKKLLYLIDKIGVDTYSQAYGTDTHLYAQKIQPNSATNVPLPSFSNFAKNQQIQIYTQELKRSPNQYYYNKLRQVLRQFDPDMNNRNSSNILTDIANLSLLKKKKKHSSSLHTYCPSVEPNSTKHLISFNNEARYFARKIVKLPNKVLLSHSSTDALWSPSLDQNAFSQTSKEKTISSFLEEMQIPLSFSLGREKEEYRGPDILDESILADHLLTILTEESIKKGPKGYKALINYYSIQASNSYYPLARLDKAIFYYMKAARLAELTNNVSGLVHIYGNLSYIYNELGDYAKGRLYANKSFHHASSLKKVDIDALLWLIHVTTMYYSGQINQTSEDLAEIKRFYKLFEKYINARNGEGSSDAHWSLMDSVWIQQKEELISQKEALDKIRGVSTKVQGCEKGFALGYAYFKHALIAYSAESLNEAEEMIHASIREYALDINPYNDWMAEALGLFAEIAESKNKPSESLEALLAQIELLDEVYPDSLVTLDNSSPLASPRVHLESLCMAYDFPVCTSEVYSKALKDLLDYVYKNATYASVRERSEVFKSLPINLGYRDLSLQSPDKDRSLLRRLLTFKGLQAEIERRQTQLISLTGSNRDLADNLHEITKRLSILRISRDERKALQNRQEELERQLYQRLPELRPRMVDVEEVAKALPDSSALIEYQRYIPYDGRQIATKRWGDARYLAMVLTPDSLIAAVDLGPAAAIEKRIQIALRASQEGLADTEQQWASVGQLVLQPLKGVITGVRTLFVSADGELNRIPFAAIPISERGELLVDAVNLRLLTSGRELLELQEPAKRARSTSLVVANPMFDGPVEDGHMKRRFMKGKEAAISSKMVVGGLRWKALPGTEKEGKAVAGLTGGMLLTQERASVWAVEQQRGPKILHIASHAFYLADQEALNTGGQSKKKENQVPKLDGDVSTSPLSGLNPLLRSGIALAGANLGATSGSQNDGYLTAFEVSQLDLKGTELVVVSACESGKGEIKAGEGVYGLRRAIAVAGARSSLLSLWRVDDEATAAFMQSFYRKLKDGMGRADALLATQREFRESAVTLWRHPYVWAAFQLSGDWRPVQGL